MTTTSGPFRALSGFSCAPTLIAALASVATMGLSACGPSSKHPDLNTLPQRQITFDDRCHLQDYFDQRNAAHAAPFRAIDEQSTETAETEADENGHIRRLTVGEGTYVVSGHDARRRLRQLLREEYDHTDDDPLGGRTELLRIHVGWWQSGLMRRLRPDRHIEIETDHGKLTFPFNPCVGEFLFGGPVYAMRRWVIDSERARAQGLSPPPRPDPTAVATTTAGDRPPPLPELPDGGRTGGGSVDASASGTGSTAGDADTAANMGVLGPLPPGVSLEELSRHNDAGQANR